MAHSKSIHRLAWEAKLRLWEEERRLAPKLKRAEKETKIAVTAFNVRVRTDWAILASPTFRAARIAERYFLTAFCPACKQEACPRPAQAQLSPGRLDQLPDSESVMQAMLPKSAIR